MDKLVLYIITIISFFSCCRTIPEAPPCPPICSDDTLSYPLEIKWESYFHEDTTTVFGLGNPIIYQDMIISAVDNYTLDGITHLYIFDANTGEKIKDIKLGKNSNSEINFIDKFLIVPSFDGLKVFDLETFELVKFADKLFKTSFTIFGNSAYLQVEYGSVQYSDSSSIFRLHIPTLELEKIYTITEEQYGGFCSFNPTSLETNAAGDTLIYGTMATAPFLLYCYNMSTDTFVWQTPVGGYDKFYSKPQLDDDKVYITQDRGAEAYNKQTGLRIWRTELDGEGGYRPSQPLLVNDRLYLKETNDHLYCLRPSDGFIIWHNTKDGGGSHSLNYFDNKLYSGGRNFKIIDAQNGNLLFKAESPYKKIDLDNLEESKREYGDFHSVTPPINGGKGLFYMSDSKRMFCFKLWEK